MNTPQDHAQRPVKSTADAEWGEVRNDHFGYEDEAERVTKRGLEDWEMVEKMADTSDHRIPYWFIALFFVLLLVATGLTFPFWGVRPGFERPWFDWGIVAGAVWSPAWAASFITWSTIVISAPTKSAHSRMTRIERKLMSDATWSCRGRMYHIPRARALP